MKKLNLALLFAVTVSFGIVGCGGGGNEAIPPENPTKAAPKDALNEEKGTMSLEVGDNP